MSVPKNRGILIAGNWKMNHGPAETQKFFAELEAAWPSLPDHSGQALASDQLQVCLFTPTLSLQAACAARGKLPVHVGAQNAHWERSGAFTGEISGPMLRQVQVGSVLLGHSERRQHFGETDEGVRRRTVSLLEQEFFVMACIGETLAERQGGQTRAVLERQLSGLFPETGSQSGAARFLGSRLVLAYEPVWAIGTGVTATPEQAEEAHLMVRDFLDRQCGPETARKSMILYGGSVTPENIDSLLAREGVDGVLVGGASLKPQGFLALVAAGARAVGSKPA